MQPNHAIILFDGVCNLCAWAVRFIIERDPRGVFLFASLQSELGQSLLTEHGIDPTNTDSFVLIQDGVAATESTAALKVARRLMPTTVAIGRSIRLLARNACTGSRRRR